MFKQPDTKDGKCRQDRPLGSGMSATGGSPLSQTAQRPSLPFAAPLGSIPAPPPVYYMQPPQMYYPPSAYAYPGGVVVNAPSKEQIEDAVRKQVRLPACLPASAKAEITYSTLSSEAP